MRCSRCCSSAAAGDKIYTHCQYSTVEYPAGVCSALAAAVLQLGSALQQITALQSLAHSSWQIRAATAFACAGTSARTHSRAAAEQQQHSSRNSSRTAVAQQQNSSRAAAVKDCGRRACCIKQGGAELNQQAWCAWVLVCWCERGWLMSACERSTRRRAERCTGRKASQ